MNNIVSIDRTFVGLTSQEIATLTGKTHGNVIRDIKMLLCELYCTDHIKSQIPCKKKNRRAEWISSNANSILMGVFKDESILIRITNQGVKWDIDDRNRIAGFVLDQNHTLNLVSGYSPALRMRIIERWDELENKQPKLETPEVADPTLSALVKSLIEIDQIKQVQHKVIEKTDNLEKRTEELEQKIDDHKEAAVDELIEGVPEGYISQKSALVKYGNGLSAAVFKLAMSTLGVKRRGYSFVTDEGFRVNTYAYLRSELKTAVDLFLQDSVQVTGKTCSSAMLHGKQFRFVKAA